MAVGLFSPEALPVGWWAPEGQPVGWFDEDLLFAEPSSGAQVLYPGLFESAASFYAAAVTSSALLVADRFNNTPVFYSATVSLGGGAQALTADRFDNSAVFYGPAVSTGGVTLTASLFSNAPVFYGATVYDPALIAPSSIRFDIGTGRMVKIISQSVCITF